MKKRLKLVILLLVFGSLFIALQFDLNTQSEITGNAVSFEIQKNTTTNLNSTHSFGTTQISQAIYDSNNSLVYLAGSGSIFGAYNRTSNTTEDLSATHSFSTSFQGIAHDKNKNLIYIAGNVGKFGVYNRTSNTTEDLSAIHTFGSLERINELIFDSGNDLIFLSGESGKLNAYNRTSNTTEDLSATDPGDWIGIFTIRGLAYDSNRSLIYISTTNGEFGAYNRTSNTTEDLSATDPGDWIGTTFINSLAYSSQDDLVYLFMRDGKLGAYNRTSNTTEDLSATDPGDWIGTNELFNGIYDSGNNLVYLVGNNGVFGFYNRTSNKTQDLRDTHSFGTTAILGLTYDSENNLIYLSGNSGKFGAYSREGIDTTLPTATASCSSASAGESFPCTCSGTDDNSGIETTTGSSNSPDGTSTPSSTGTFIYTCTVTDKAGNSKTDTAEYTITSATSSGGGGSGTSGTVSEDTTETQITKTNIITSITPDEPIKATSFDKTGVKEIEIEVKSETQNVKISVSSHDSKPEQVSKEASGRVYRYMEINVENINETLNKARVRFEVEKSWIENNSLDSESLIVSKFNESSKEWMELETTIEEGDEENYVYLVELNSFSFFAIGEKIKQVLQEDAISNHTTSEQEEFERKLNPGFILWLIIIVFLIIGIIFNIIKIRNSAKNVRLENKNKTSQQKNYSLKKDLFDNEFNK